MFAGTVNTSFYSGWRMIPWESVKSVQLPRAPCKIPLSRLYRTQNNIATPQQQFTRAPIQELTCAPSHLTWALDRQCAGAYPTQNRDSACPTQLRGDACFTQNRDEACRTQLQGDACFTQNRDETCPSQRNRTEEYPTLQQTETRSTQQRAEPCPIQHQVCPTCQCSPELLLELFKLAVTGGKLHGIPTICRECPEPETLARAPPAEPAPGDPSSCSSFFTYFVTYFL